MKTGLLFFRSLFYFAGQILSSVVVCLLALMCFALPSLTRSKVIGLWARFNIWTLGILCGTHYRVSGAENIPTTPAIIISNHQSAWETLGFQLIFPAQSYLLKKELLWIPFFGWGLALNRPIAIDRSKKIRALDTLVKEGVIRLKEGRWLVIFPEGTRGNPGEMGKFQVGGAMIAAKSGCPVVPVAHNSGLFWPKKSFLKYPGTIDVVIGPVIVSRGKKARQINREVEDWIVSKQKNLVGRNRSSLPPRGGVTEVEPSGDG